MEITIPVTELVEGDQYIGPDGYAQWTAKSDATLIDGDIMLDVVFGDGGHSSRVWEDPGTEITVTRTDP